MSEIEMIHWVEFNDLPVEAQYALREYFYLHSDEAFEKEMSKRCFRQFVISAEEAKRCCMDCSPDLKEEHGTFESYHEWYLAGGDIPDHGSSLWPCIHPGIDEWLDDGWHRFHSYIQKGFLQIPLLEFKYKERSQ